MAIFWLLCTLIGWAGVADAQTTLPTAPPAPPAIHDTTRVVAVGGAVTEIVYDLDAGANLVGVDTSSTYPELARQLPQVGYQRTLAAEGVVFLQPDLLLSRLRRVRQPPSPRYERRGSWDSSFQLLTPSRGCGTKSRSLPKLSGASHRGRGYGSPSSRIWRRPGRSWRRSLRDPGFSLSMLVAVAPYTSRVTARPPRQ